MNDEFNNDELDVDEEVNVEEQIEINYSYNKHPRRGYHCAFTNGMDKYGAPELCLMDYYSPDEARFILLNVADCILNGEFYNQETEEYDFFTIIELNNEHGELLYKFGFIGGTLYDQEVMCLQQLGDDDIPIHPGADFLPSYIKRGFDVWPIFMYMEDDEQEQNG